MLDLSRDERLIEAAARALRNDGAGGRAARLLGGGGAIHARVERLCADWIGSEGALFFPSGYQANLGMVGALCEAGDVLFSDALVHASLIDAARLARAKVVVHRHLDLEQLEEQLRGHASARRRWILTEGIFSMDGDRGPLGALAELAERTDAWLLVDEAHSVGVIGESGRGVWSEDGQNAPARVAARVITGGKAMGCTGAFLCGDQNLIDWTANRGRSFVFSTAPSPAVAGAWEAAIPIVAAADEARAQVWSNAKQLAACFGGLAPAAAIVPCPIGEPEDAMRAAEEIQAAGFDVRAVRPPTVPVGTSRLRCVVRAGHTTEQINGLGKLLAQHAHVELGSPPKVAGAGRNAKAQRILIIAGTDTDVGKTVTSALVLATALQRGPARYWKPLQTGDDSDTETVRSLTGAEASVFSDPLCHFPLPASPDQAAEEAGARIPTEALTPALDRLEQASPGAQLILELAGGLLVPYDEHATQLDWLAALGARIEVILAARSGLGTLNHTLLSLAALRERSVPVRSLVLVGPPHPGNRISLAPRIGPLPVVELPPLDPLNAATLEAFRSQLGDPPWLS